MTNTTTILLVGHGSRGREGNTETINFAAQWREHHPEWRIEVCFIEHADVLLDEGLDRAARGAEKVLVIPFILNAAGHVKMELPAALDQARERHPEVKFGVTRHLGMGREIYTVLQGQLDRLMKQLAVPDPMTTGVVLLGRGSSDAGANGELAKMARWIFEANEHELVDLAFTGVTWPRLETAVQRQVKLGMMQVCIVPVYLFGFDKGIFDLLDEKVSGELPEGQMLECDGCKYRELAEEEHLHDHSHTATGGCGHAHGHAPDHKHEHTHGCAHKHG